MNGFEFIFVLGGFSIIISMFNCLLITLQYTFHMADTLHCVSFCWHIVNKIYFDFPYNLQNASTKEKFLSSLKMFTVNPPYSRSLWNLYSTVYTLFAENLPICGILH